MPEILLHYIWQHCLWAGFPQTTTDGRPVEILSVGQHNIDAGPDFANVHLRIGEQEWYGNVEIHLTSSDWYTHKHHLNPAYGNEQNYISWPALGNLNVSTHGNFGYGDVVMNNPMFGKGSDKKMTTFLNPYISSSDALSGFSKGNNRISGSVRLIKRV